mgnify:CR=1 FL=1
MKNLFVHLCSLLVLALALNSCIEGDDDIARIPDTKYEPILMKRSDLEKSVSLMPPQPLQNTGKIYVKDNFIFVNERYRGVHVIDNTDPKNPENKGFIRVPGNIDLAVKGNFIYVDNAVDMVTLRWFGDSLKVTDRVKEVFPAFEPPDGGFYQFAERPENTVIVKWEEK